MGSEKDTRVTKAIKILVVDDNEGIRRLSSEILSLGGYEVYTASSGYEALSKLMDEGFDLIVTDVEMKGLDGISLYKSASEMQPGLKDRFIFMTGSSRADVVSAIRGFDRKCIMKPFRNRDLLLEVDAHIAANNMALCAWHARRSA